MFYALLSVGDTGESATAGEGAGSRAEGRAVHVVTCLCYHMSVLSGDTGEPATAGAGAGCRAEGRAVQEQTRDAPRTGHQGMVFIFYSYCDYLLKL